MQNFINTLFWPWEQLMAVIQGDVDIGGFACLYLFYFSIQHYITCKNQSSFGSRPSSHICFVHHTFLCTRWGPVCLRTVRGSTWLLKFPSCPLIHQTNPVQLKGKPQNHFIPSSPKFIFYLTKMVPNVLLYRLLNLDFDLMLDTLLSINTFISGCFLI